MFDILVTHYSCIGTLDILSLSFHLFAANGLFYSIMPGKLQKAPNLDPIWWIPPNYLGSAPKCS